jgi:arylsulfatase A-like enzyme
MRVPFIAAWAKLNDQHPYQSMLSIPQDAVQSQLAAVPDLLPTVLEIAELSAPTGHIVDGSSLLTLLRGSHDPARQEQFLMHYPHAPHRSDYFTVYRDGDWKVIYHYFPTEVSNGSHYQLFNLANDPFESTDLAAQEPQRLAKMMHSLVSQLEEHNAQYPVSSPDESEPVRPQLP